MPVLTTQYKRWLLAALCMCLWTASAFAAECTNCSSCGENCTPNVQSYGYIPTQWRRWPGTEMQASAPNNRREPFPAPRYELPKPLREAEGGPTLAVPMIGSPMGTMMEPSTGLPDSTRPMEGRPSGSNPFQRPTNPSNNGDRPTPDSSSRQRTPLPELARPNTSHRVTPASAIIAEPANAGKPNVANPLRDEPIAGWRPVGNSTDTTRSAESLNDSSQAKPRSNPLRDN